MKNYRLLAVMFSFVLVAGFASPAYGGAPSPFMVEPTGETATEFNGHCYAFISSNGISFDTAFAEASTKSVNGNPGHLATYSNLAEETASDATSGGAKGWIGYTSDVTFAPGPYDADGFGWIDGTPATFANWAAGEPSGDGAYTENNQAGSLWNDVPNSGFGTVQGYYVEFESCFSVGGESLPIDSTALMIAGLQSSVFWMLPILAGAAGVGVFYFKTRMHKD